MYLISRSAGLTMPIRGSKTHYTPKGDVDHVDPALSIQFAPAGDVPPYAREAVAKLANWGVGLAEHEDPFTRCGAYDTDIEAELQGWSAEDKEYVERALRNAASNGIEFVIVTAPKAPKPWPKYDEIVGEQAAQQIAFYADQLGVDPGAIRQYERENLGREDVIAEMERRLEAEAENVVGVISA